MHLYFVLSVFTSKDLSPVLEDDEEQAYGCVTLPGFESLCSEDDNCLFTGCLPCQQRVTVSQRQNCADTYTCCHTETEVAGQTCYINWSQYADPGHPVKAPTLEPQAPGTAATRATILKSLVGLDRGKWESIPGSAALEADA